MDVVVEAIMPEDELLLAPLEPDGEEGIDVAVLNVDAAGWKGVNWML